MTLCHCGLVANMLKDHIAVIFSGMHLKQSLQTTHYTKDLNIHLPTSLRMFVAVSLFKKK